MLYGFITSLGALSIIIMSATMVLHIWITLLLNCRLELNIHCIELCCLCVLCKIYTLVYLRLSVAAH